MRNAYIVTHQGYAEHCTAFETRELAQEFADLLTPHRDCEVRHVFILQGGDARNLINEERAYWRDLENENT